MARRTTQNAERKHRGIDLMEIATTGRRGEPRYKNGFKSLPRLEMMYETYAETLKEEGELPLEEPNSITVDL